MTMNFRALRLPTPAAQQRGAAMVEERRSKEVDAASWLTDRDAASPSPPEKQPRHYVGDEERRASVAAHTCTTPPTSSLSWIASCSYSVGHFLNDATASCWFSYLLLYLTQAQGLSGSQAGIVLFSGCVRYALTHACRRSTLASVGGARRSAEGSAASV